MISTRGYGTNRRACYRCDYCGKILKGDEMVIVRDPASDENDGDVRHERHFCNKNQASKWIVQNYNLRLFDE